jgi:hypothetical protein
MRRAAPVLERPGNMKSRIDQLAGTIVLGSLLEELVRAYGRYDLLAHWQQGEFHHDLVLGMPETARDLLGRILIVSTNCNGGVKEVASFSEVPDRLTLWAHRCAPPGTPLPPLPLLASSRTFHWIDPSELLGEDARSELRPEFRRRQEGGGWEPLPGVNKRS